MNKGLSIKNGTLVLINSYLHPAFTKVSQILGPSPTVRHTL